MSRARTPASPLDRLIASGRLAAVDIGLETIVLPAALAHKLLPLLEQAASVSDGYGAASIWGGPVHLAAMMQPRYRLLAEGQAVLGPRQRTAEAGQES